MVGDPIGSFEFTVTPELMARRSWALDDYHPWYMDDSPFGGRIASPTLSLRFDGDLFYGFYKYPATGSLFAKQEFEFHEPMRVGETYRMTAVLSDIRKRKGRTFYTMTVSITDRSGVEAVRASKTIAAPVQPLEG